MKMLLVYSKEGTENLAKHHFLILNGLSLHKASLAIMLLYKISSSSSFLVLK